MNILSVKINPGNTIATFAIGLFFLYFALFPIYELARRYELFFFVNRNYLSLMGSVLYLMLNWVFITKRSAPLIHIGSNFIGLQLLICICIIQIISYPWVLQYSSNAGDLYTQVIGNTFINSVMLWMVGTNINSFRLLLTRFRLVVSFFYLLFIGIILYGVHLNSFSWNSIDSFQVYRGQLNIPYLTISDCFAIISLLFMASFRSFGVQLLVGSLGVIFLYATHSRTSFYAYIFTFLVIMFIKFVKQHSQYKVLVVLTGLIVVLTTLGVLTSNNFNYDSNLKDQRMFHVVTNISQDSSYQARNNLLEEGMDDLRNNWLLGKFMAEIDRTGLYGSYMHNWLSFWSSYGILPFIVFVLLSGYIFISIFKLFMKDPGDSLYFFLFGVTLFVMICIWFSRAYTFPYVWFVLAAVSSVIIEKKKRGYSKSLLKPNKWPSNLSADVYKVKK